MENVSKEVPFMYLLAGANTFVTRVEYRTERYGIYNMHRIMPDFGAIATQPNYLPLLNIYTFRFYADS